MGGTYEIDGGGAMKLMKGRAMILIGAGYEIDRGGVCNGWGGL